MDAFSPISQPGTTNFSLEEAKLKSLTRKLENRENKEDLMKTAKQFEAVLVNQLLTAMDKTVDRSGGILNGGSAEETFRGLMYQNVAENISSRTGGSGFGIAEAIYRQFESQVRPSDKNEGELSKRGSGESGIKEIKE
jgi:Rod binding domain-containing protein